MTLILGIESSCDDTAAAVVDMPARRIQSNRVHTQDDHAAFGGVVPEIAARAHAEKLDTTVSAAMAEAGVTWRDLSAIAVTAGPGLIGGVLSGVMCAKGIAAGTGLPLLGVNHLAGHALTPVLTDGLAYPYLMLLVSGGHCQFLIVHAHDRFTRLGGTIDDAPGEAFDKVARLLGLPQPGGPSVEHCAAGGETTIPLPRPLLDRPDCNLSFSGLKTAVLRVRDRAISQDGGLKESVRANICASFQDAVAEVLVAKARGALEMYLSEHPETPAFAVAGGVAANQTLRRQLQSLCTEMGVAYTAPPLALCTDNAAMIAFAGGLRYAAGQIDDLTLSARPRWPLDDAAPALIGSGKKGAKA
ncbi:MAG: tRNA (adenosine(37)-N6)-threonylcarbamoyltransferase complex transferase subunit TsaD [Shimia sp.]